jgi:hypothetical protein
MSKQTELDSRFYLFLFKSAACFLGLLLGSFIFAPQASMQDKSRRVASNVAVVVSNNSVMIGNYRPTPEPPKATVRGRVFYADTGKPVKRASLMFIPEDSSGGPSRSPSGLTDGEGNFVMKDVAAGTYYAMVNAPGVYSPLAYVDFASARSGDGEKEAFKKAFAGFEPIVTDGVTEIFVQIPARRGGAIGGRVIYDDGDAAIGVKVEILRKVEDKFVSSIPNFSTILSMRTGGGVFQTDDRGVYRFAGLPPGEYIIKVSENASHTENADRRYYDPFEGSLTGKSFLSVFYPDASDTKSAQLISVGAAQEISEINLTLPSRNLYKIEGKAIARKDKSPVKARVNIKRKNEEEIFSIFDDLGGRQQAAMTDETGNWKFKELPKGTYTITIEPIPDEPDYSSYQIYSNTNSTSRMSNRANNSPPKPKLAKKVHEITIEDKDLNEIVVELGYGAIVSGTVTTENSQEMPNRVSIYASQDDYETSSSDTVNNSLDRESMTPQKIIHDFRIENVAEGKIEFFITASEDDFYVKSATVNGTDLLAGLVDIKEGDNLQNVRIVLSKAVGTLKGVVLDESKAPVKNAKISLVPVDAVKGKNASFYRQIQINEDGEFEVKAAPMEYAVVFFDKFSRALKGEEFDRRLDEMIKESRKITIKANETEKVSLTAPK